MTRPVVITVAITGSVPTKKDNPAVPVIPGEQIEATHAAFEAGASLVHVHVRDAEQKPSSDAGLFAEVQAGVRKHCPGMIVQFSTGGRGRDAKARGSALSLRPDMASLATGSVNFPNAVYENHPALVDDLASTMIANEIKPEVEVFDLAMLYNARALADRGLLKTPAHVQFVMGIANALPARRRVLEFLVEELYEVLPGATWTAAGIGRHQGQVAEWAAALGGNVRTGLEDNLRLDKSRLAASNAELVGVAAEIVARHGGKPASPAEARKLLGLRAA
jgi:uncharacterized protein (DUF849 family)